MILRFLARTLLCFTLLALLWVTGFAWFFYQIPTAPSQHTEHTDAIVVLTGGPKRIAYGLQLLIDGKADRLFISGVETKLSPISFITRIEPKLAAELPNRDAVVMLGYDARNTIGNAMETAQWMRRENLKSLRLVTADYHMPRSLNEFRFVLPEATIIPDAVIAKEPSIRFDLKGLAGEYHKLVAAQLRHWLLKVADDV